MGVARLLAVGTVGAFAASLVALAPATGAPTRANAIKARAVPAGRIGVIQTGIGSFTPASADPQLAAALSRSGISANAFQFTPAASLRVNRSVTVAVRARTNIGPVQQPQQVALVAPAAASAIAPVAYNLGLSLGWRKFAVSGDLQKLDVAGIGRRDAVDLGVSYTTQRLTTRVQLGADRASGVVPRMGLTGGGLNGGGVGANEQAYQVDFGGSYSLSRNLAVTAGVRYRAEREQRLLTRGDTRRDSQAVYVGTAVRF